MKTVAAQSHLTKQFFIVHKLIMFEQLKILNGKGNEWVIHYFVFAGLFILLFIWNMFIIFSTKIQQSRKIRNLFPSMLSHPHSSALSMPEIAEKDPENNFPHSSIHAQQNRLPKPRPSGSSSIHSAKNMFIFSLLIFTAGKRF